MRLQFVHAFVMYVYRSECLFLYVWMCLSSCNVCAIAAVKCNQIIHSSFCKPSLANRKKTKHWMNEWMNGRQLEKIIWWIYKEQTMYAMEQKKGSELKQTEYISITLKMKWKKRLATSQHIRTQPWHVYKCVYEMMTQRKINSLIVRNVSTLLWDFRDCNFGNVLFWNGVLHVSRKAIQTPLKIKVK